jgi:hypothetical protein
MALRSHIVTDRLHLVEALSGAARSLIGMKVLAAMARAAGDGVADAGVQFAAALGNSPR